MECTVNLILNGPPKGWKENVKIFVSASDLSLAQPALCCHSVLTLSKGPAFVTGWDQAQSANTELFRHWALCENTLRVAEREEYEPNRSYY